jgi:hypothetical protein
MLVGNLILLVVYLKYSGTRKTITLVNEVGDTSQNDSSNNRAFIDNYLKRAERAWLRTVRQRRAVRDEFNSVDGTNYTAWDLTPPAYGCPHDMERIGRLGDGGKWVCGISKLSESSKDKPCVIYSIGVGTDSSYEDEMLRRTRCEVWAFDVSQVDFVQRFSDEYRNRAHFFRVNGASKTNLKKTATYNIAHLMKTYGHDYV